MRLVHGKAVFSDPGELLAADHTAIAVIDMQNDFCSPGGHFDKAGKDLADIQDMIPRLLRFLDEARRRGLPVFHVQQTTLPGGAADSAAWLYLKTRRGGDPDYTVDGTWGHDFVPGCEPLPGEPVVRKHRSSGFVNTTLPTLLGARGSATLVCTGVTTQGCVESTARDAVFFDFHAAVARDCVASTRRDLHEASLLVQSVRHEILSSDEILALWDAA